MVRRLREKGRSEAAKVPPNPSKVRPETGVLVLGHRRPALLRNTLESLRQQRAITNTHVWLDGHQGFAELVPQVEACRVEVGRYPVGRLVAYEGHVGIDKLMLDALRSTASRFERIIVLEDDCFPTVHAIETFETDLDAIASAPSLFSVYGHHFLVKAESDTLTRFQGWGWATTRDKLLPILEQVAMCYSLDEVSFREWCREHVTADVESRLAVTPGRDPLEVVNRFFSWDACVCVVTASMRLEHKKSSRRVVFNCGLGDGSGHFRGTKRRFRQPPFNMIAPEEVWDVFAT